jgi:tRNA G18 (ribose-2'-O)-methylase SpoU
VALTARPLAIEGQLREQERKIVGGVGSGMQRLPFVAVIDNVRSLWNVGSIFRTADGCGIEKLFLTGISGCPPRKEISKTALGAEESVAWEYRATAEAALDTVVGAGYELVALETGETALPIDQFAWPQRPALIVGNEVAGVDPALLSRCSHHVTIPMLGAKNSFNVAVAFAIAAFAGSRALQGSVKCD